MRDRASAVPVQETPPASGQVGARPGAAGTARPLVELAGVSCRRGRRTVLRDVDLSIQPGEFVYLTGPNAAGKTTLLELIHGDVRPARGRVRVAGLRLDRRWRRSLPRLRRRVAAVFQHGRLLASMTARGNVAFTLRVVDLWLSRAEVRGRAQARLDEVGLEAESRALPHELSAGQQRLLAIARALAHEPVLLLADEPTANLDRTNAERVMELLERCCRAGATVVVATNDFELTRMRPHRVIGLRAGRVVADWPVGMPLAVRAAAPGARAHLRLPMTMTGSWRPPGHEGPQPRFSAQPAPPPEPEAPAAARRSAPRRLPWRPVLNLWRLVVGGGIAAWARNFSTIAPALGSITLLLLLVGVISVSGLALRTALGYEASEASVLRVYLDDGATSDQVDQARHDLARAAHVRAVRLVDREQALADARSRPGLADLASLSGTNPFPASLEVRVDQPGDVAAVARVAAAAPGVDSRHATSYDPGTYQRLAQLTVVGAAIGAAFALLLLIVTYTVSGNSIRAAVLARREELMTMQLVGASPWLIRGRLAVEGGLTGGVAGVLASAAIAGACAAAYAGAQRLFIEILPGVSLPAAAAAAGGAALIGLCLGAISALFSFRRLRA